ncbi:MAG: hypothetical protein HY691_13965 [Chloroflexi bacterium]|nr:hypothetical protein [Chloroflexota bacterium]
MRERLSDDIELRDYLDVAGRHIVLVVVATVVALAVGVGYTLLQPQKHEAVALLLISRQLPQRPSFDPRFPPPDVQTASKAIAVLLHSPGVAAKVVQDLRGRLPAGVQGAAEEVTIEVLRDDASLVRVAARHADPQVAAAVANAWADTGAREVSEMYSQSQRALKLVNEQLRVTEGELRAVGGELRDFYARSQIALLQNRVNQGNAYLAQLLAAQQRIGLTLADAERVRQQLAAGGEATVADGLLQLLVLDWTVARGAPAPPVAVPGTRQAESPQATAPASAPSAPVQLQIAVEQLRVADRPVSERLRNLDILTRALDEERQALNRQLEQETAALQGARRDLAVEMAEEERLNLGFEATRRTYQTLSNKADELRIATQSDVLPAQVASPAALPDRPAPRPWLLHLGVAVAVGIFVGVLGAFVVNSLPSARAPRRRPAPELAVTKER